MRRKRTLTLILGGARSGKSRFAEQIAGKMKRVTFIATARPSDAEMRRKIARHRSERPASWETIEAPVALAEAIASQNSKTDIIIIDCLTLYVDNVTSTHGGDVPKVERDFDRVCREIQRSRSSVIVVSNEVGCGLVPAFRSGRRYRDLLGRLNQRVADIADQVILMVAGIPLAVKEPVAK
jgi:adenosylcobinamide kinase / adenosylcobinamide-phosphate guanylyltransferase